MNNDKLIIKLLEIERQIQNGQIPDIEETEDYVSGKFDLILYSFNSEKAFILLNLLSQNCESLFSEYKEAYISVFIKLIEKSKTAEKPDNIDNSVKYFTGENLQYIKGLYDI